MDREKKYTVHRKTVLCILVSILTASFFTAAVLGRREALAQADRLQKHLAEEVFRFHVLANSDSKEDQALKLQVKDAVVTYMKEHLPDAGSADETKRWCKKYQTDIIRTAREVLRSGGSKDTVGIRIGTCSFPEKTYGDITFPAGDYEALEIRIGEAKGHNWWCVLYPDLCFTDPVHAVVPKEGKEKLQHVLTEEEYRMVTAMDDFKVSWFFFGGGDKKEEKYEEK